MKLYLRRLVKIRQRLITKQASRKNRSAMQQAAQFIQIHLDANEHKYTNLGLAKFFIRHQYAIRSLIPERRSGAHEKLIKEFKRYLMICERELEKERVEL